jgi:hypothetical protein
LAERVVAKCWYGQSRHIERRMRMTRRLITGAGPIYLLAVQIRPEQMQVFADYALEQFVAHMRLDLRTRFPAETQTMSDDQLVDRIRTGIAKAKCYGLTLQDHVRAYLEFDVTYGPDFDVSDATGWAGRILRNHRLTADAKLQALEDHQLFPG